MASKSQKCSLPLVYKDSLRGGKMVYSQLFIEVHSVLQKKWLIINILRSNSIIFPLKSNRHLNCNLSYSNWHQNCNLPDFQSHPMCNTITDKAGKGWKWLALLELTWIWRKLLKWLEMAGNDWNGWKWLNIGRNAWKWLEMTENI